MLVKCLRRENKDSQAISPFSSFRVIRPRLSLISSMDYEDRPKLSVDAEKEITRLWRTWKTVLEMLVDRVCSGQMIWTFL